MPEEKTIKDYTAADIEKYWQGKMSSEEMHALEKAALDDPFLADALEGYNQTASAADDIAQLKEKLAERTGSLAKVAKMPEKTVWWKVAALIIGLAGVGYAAVQLFTNNNRASMAIESASEDKAEEKQSLGQDSIRTYSDSGTFALTKKESSNAGNTKAKASKGSVTYDTAYASSNITAGPPQNNAQEEVKEDQLKITAGINAIKADTLTNTKDIAKSERKEEKNVDKKNPADDKVYQEKDLSEGILSKKSSARGNAKALNFSGRVIDANNNAVPYANVYNISNEQKTLAGIDGYFSIRVDPDSLVLLDVSSQGFFSREFRLNRFDKKNNNLILFPADADDEEPGEITIEAELYDPLLLKNEKVEFPEPEYGWILFNQYMANNLTRNKESLTTGTVTLSFSINKTGRPSQIQVVTSLSKECDNEAIRLLKEGPHWTVKGKSNNVMLLVRFR